MGGWCRNGASSPSHPPHLDSEPRGAWAAHLGGVARKAAGPHETGPPDVTERAGGAIRIGGGGARGGGGGEVPRHGSPAGGGDAGGGALG